MQQCPRCVEESKSKFSYLIRHIPKTGRAAKNGLCTKCDREINGPLTLPDWLNVGKWCRAFARALKNSKSAGADK